MPSAPFPVFLYGDFLYEFIPVLGFPTEQRIDVVSEEGHGTFPSLEYSKEFIKSVEKVFFDKYNIKLDRKIFIESDFSNIPGFYESLAVATTRELIKQYDIMESRDGLSDTAYRIVENMDISGPLSKYMVDIAVFDSGFKFYEGKVSIDKPNLLLILLEDSIKGDPYILKKSEGKIFEYLINAANRCSSYSEIYINAREWRRLGNIMNIYYGILRSMNIFNFEVEQIWHILKEEGALGITISKDYVLALFDDKEKQKEADNNMRDYGYMTLTV